MPLENTPPVIDDVVETALASGIQAAIDTLEAFNINLSIEDRKTATSIGARRTAFILSYFENTDDFPTLKPAFMDENEVKGHLAVLRHLANVKLKAAKLLEMVDDLTINSQHFVYQYALEGYATVQRGKEKNVAGADTFYNMLRPNFTQDNSNDDDGGPGDDTNPAPSNDTSNT